MKKNNLSFEHVISLKEETIFDFNGLYNNLFFIKKGKAELTYNSYRQIVNFGEMFFVPKKTPATVTLSEDADVVVYSFPELSKFQLLFTAEELNQYKATSAFTSLKMIRSIRSYLDLVILYLEADLLCEDLLALKETELFLIIQEFYTVPQQIAFFYPEFGLKNNITSY